MFWPRGQRSARWTSRTSRHPSRQCRRFLVVQAVGKESPWMQQQWVAHLLSVCAMASAGTGLRGVAPQGYAGSNTSALIVATSQIMRLCVPANSEGSSCCLWRSLSQGLCCAANQAMLGVSMSCSTSSSGHALPRPTASATTMATLVVVTLIAFV